MPLRRCRALLRLVPARNTAKGRKKRQESEQAQLGNYGHYQPDSGQGVYGAQAPQLAVPRQGTGFMGDGFDLRKYAGGRHHPWLDPHREVYGWREKHAASLAALREEGAEGRAFADVEPMRTRPPPAPWAAGGAAPALLPPPRALPPAGPSVSVSGEVGVRAGAPAEAPAAAAAADLLTGSGGALGAELRRLQKDERHRRRKRRCVVRGAAAAAAAAARGAVALQVLLPAGVGVPPPLASLAASRPSWRSPLVARCTPKVLDKVARGADAACIFRLPPEEPAEALWAPGGAPMRRVAALLDVPDARQLGRLLRTCAAMRYDAVLLDWRCADPYSDAALDAAACAHLPPGALSVRRLPAAEAESWDALRRTAARHRLLPVAAATAADDLPGAATAAAVWARLRADGDEARGMLVCVGGGADGLDVDRVRFHLGDEVVPAAVPLSAHIPSLDPAASAAVLMHTLHRPTYAAELPPAAPAPEPPMARLRYVIPKTEPAAAAADLPPPRVLRVSKSYKGGQGGRPPAYRTEWVPA